MDQSLTEYRGSLTDEGVNKSTIVRFDPQLPDTCELVVFRLSDVSAIRDIIASNLKKYIVPCIDPRIPEILAVFDTVGYLTKYSRPVTVIKLLSGLLENHTSEDVEFMRDCGLYLDSGQMLFNSNPKKVVALDKNNCLDKLKQLCGDFRTVLYIYLNEPDYADHNIAASKIEKYMELNNRGGFKDYIIVTSISTITNTAIAGEMPLLTFDSIYSMFHYAISNASLNPYGILPSLRIGDAISSVYLNVYALMKKHGHRVYLQDGSDREIGRHLFKIWYEFDIEAKSIVEFINDLTSAPRDIIAYRIHDVIAHVINFDVYITAIHIYREDGKAEETLVTIPYDSLLKVYSVTDDEDIITIMTSAPYASSKRSFIYEDELYVIEDIHGIEIRLHSDAESAINSITVRSKANLPITSRISKYYGVIGDYSEENLKQRYLRFLSRPAIGLQNHKLSEIEDILPSRFDLYCLRKFKVSSKSMILRYGYEPCDVALWLYEDAAIRELTENSLKTARRGKWIGTDVRKYLPPLFKIGLSAECGCPNFIFFSFGGPEGVGVKCLIDFLA
jgi:hypothetical protein